MDFDASYLINMAAHLTGTTTDQVKERVWNLICSDCEPEEAFLMGFLGLALDASRPGYPAPLEGVDPVRDEIYNHADKYLGALPVPTDGISRDVSDVFEPAPKAE